MEKDTLYIWGEFSSNKDIAINIKKEKLKQMLDEKQDCFKAILKENYKDIIKDVIKFEIRVLELKSMNLAEVSIIAKLLVNDRYSLTEIAADVQEFVIDYCELEQWSQTIIVSRHSEAINWLQKKGIRGWTIEHINDSIIEEIKEDYKVYGVLPIPIIKQILDKGAEVYLINLPAVAVGQRGKELTVEEMDKAGAKIIKISKLELKEVKL